MAGANELGLYAFLKSILAASMVIEGRFAVLSGVNGIDMNVTNFAQPIADALTGFVEEKKYPCALMTPPYETEQRNDKGWSTYVIQMFFLTLNKRTGDGDVKNPDLQTGISTHTYQEDWKDMREVAGNFREMIHQVLLANKDVMALIRDKPHATDQYHRIKGIGNDQANGVHLSFAMQVWNGFNCNPLADYPDPSQIVLPSDLNPHNLHNQ